MDNEFGHDMNTRPSKEAVFRRSKGNQSRPLPDSSTLLTGTEPRRGRQIELERGPDFVNRQAPCLVCPGRHEIWKCERFRGFTHCATRWTL